MTPSSWLYSFLKSYEKFRPTAFKPTVNDVWTIAWGHTRGVKEGDTCTMAQGEVWIHEDIGWAVADVNGKAKVPLNQNQFDALGSLTFNIGGPAFEGSTLLRLLNAGDYAGCAAQFPRWDRQAGAVLNGLLGRRDAEMAHFKAAL